MLCSRRRAAADPAADRKRRRRLRYRGHRQARAQDPTKSVILGMEQIVARGEGATAKLEAVKSKLPIGEVAKALEGVEGVTRTPMKNSVSADRPAFRTSLEGLRRTSRHRLSTRRTAPKWCSLFAPSVLAMRTYRHARISKIACSTRNWPLSPNAICAI